ncbi:hypothetical protein PACTADRAFT_36675 [Pachysolen tannophilus NRRL Y-2460]|uniref:PUM-HD domain-containing protein n=1 Tax=Pachysolen tannophilus NRRL Y-2460 TaxID=669874 RepID=A0A1E4U240_PACTA|nr:hypothetical protein PACTADRAFT_36675 [Pachysolen tannophilus NRRL Y-2460]
MNVHRNKSLNNSRRKGEDPSKYIGAKLDDFKGDIYSLCKDQHGCRFLQKQLDLDDELKTTLIFNETYLNVVELMVDPFGNYLIQKLLEKANEEQRIVLVKIASSHFYEIALDSHGTRALQKLVECVATEEEAKIIVESLSPNIVSLSRDLNGNHVVQKCLSKLSASDNQFIFDIICENCNLIATHRHGCCVLQRCLDFGTLEQCKALCSKINENVLTLAVDPFGNYVVQYILNREELIESDNKELDELISKILNVINENIIELSLHKFGSNVIEKVLRLSNFSEKLIDNLISTHQDDIVKLLNDSYGNYVLQTSLDVAQFDQFNRLKNILVPLMVDVKNTPHGRRISTRLGINNNTSNNNSNNFPRNAYSIVN